ncbi:MAG: hypothetical protein ABL901_07280 [Hyphomicrobiaceae bacterium]
MIWGNNHWANAVRAGALAAVLMAPSGLSAQSARRDGIADLINKTEPKALVPNAAAGAPAAAAVAADPREGDAAFEAARKLMAAVDAILQDTAKQRSEGKKLPGKDEFVIPPFFTETREDRDVKVQALLNAALGVVTDVPVVDTQKKIEGLRKNIRDIDEQITKAKEKQIAAPKDGMLPGVLTDTVDSLGAQIVELGKKIELNRAEIKAAKAEIVTGLQNSGLKLTPEQVDLLLDSVLSGDLVRLVAVFNAAKVIDGQLGKLMASSGDNLNASRKYFAMHAALFAMLVQSQDATIAKIDTNYGPKLDAILKDIQAARTKTGELMRAENRPDQKRALEANRDAQKLAEDAAKSYKRYLSQQREQLAKARLKAAHDLRIADNTYETVEASFQLRNLMKDSAQSFEALQKLEAPTFEQIFRNEELRKEFENLTRKLDTPTS